MPVAYRLSQKKYAATAFDGEGAALGGGRWNSKGTRVVYASSSISLAVLETLVHINPAVPLEYVFFVIRFDESLLLRLPPSKLPSDWARVPAFSSSMAIGDNWVRKGESVILELPSTIVPGESNFIINPAHPDIKKLAVSSPESISIDPRLTRAPLSSPK